MYLELGPARRLGRESLVSCRCKGDDEEGRLGRHPTMGSGAGNTGSGRSQTGRNQGSSSRIRRRSVDCSSSYRV